MRFKVMLATLCGKVKVLPRKEFNAVQHVHAPWTQCVRLVASRAVRVWYSVCP